MRPFRLNGFRIFVMVLLITPAFLLASFVDPSSPLLRYSGRWDFQNESAPAFQWPGSSISFGIRCRGPTDISAKFNTHDPNTKFGIYLNEGAPNAAVLPYQIAQPSSKPFEVRIKNFSAVSDLQVVTIVKITEDFKPNPAQGSKSMVQAPCVFYGLEVDAGASCVLSAPPKPTRRMQFIGDSITCGFGNQLQLNDTISKYKCLAESGAAAVTNIIGEEMCILEDTHESFSMQLARKFGAEAHVQCLSGIGMCKNALELSPTNIHNMTYFIDRTLPFQDGSIWNYDWQPDVLVVNLGTNDYDTSTGPIAPTYEAFQASYVHFIEHIMSHYSSTSTKVVLACGPMTNRFCPYVQAAAVELANRFAIGYVNISLPESPLGCLGCALHPNQAEDTQMVDLMVPLVKRLTGW